MDLEKIVRFQLGWRRYKIRAILGHQFQRTRAGSTKNKLNFAHHKFAHVGQMCS